MSLSRVTAIIWFIFGALLLVSGRTDIINSLEDVVGFLIVCFSIFLLEISDIKGMLSK